MQADQRALMSKTLVSTGRYVAICEIDLGPHPHPMWNYTWA